MDFPNSPWILFLKVNVLSARLKNYSRNKFRIHSKSFFLILLHFLNPVKWLQYLKYVNQIARSKPYVHHNSGLNTNFLGSKSFLEWNSPDILAFSDTNLKWFKWLWYLSVRGYLPLVWKGYVNLDKWSTSISLPLKLWRILFVF